MTFDSKKPAPLQSQEFQPIGGVFAQDQKVGSAAVALSHANSNPARVGFNLSAKIGFMFCGITEAIRERKIFPSLRRNSGKGSNRRLEFELGAWFEGACGFALVLALSQMREHGLGPFGRADLHPRRNPLDRQGRFTPLPAYA